ncbi:MAG TPA: hypothetical protein VJQ56_02050 [Blastocatellia bacterium]|nr:hypothetical protein [Blastocatellia bacterium]
MTMTKDGPAPGTDDRRWINRMLTQGWVAVAVWMTFGLLLEGFLGYKIPGYTDDLERRELFRLAHTHGTFLGLVLVAAALTGKHLSAAPPRQIRGALRLGALLMPLGFLLAGVSHPEGDPGIAIWLVPPAALLAIFGVIGLALAAKRT